MSNSDGVVIWMETADGEEVPKLALLKENIARALYVRQRADIDSPDREAFFRDRWDFTVSEGTKTDYRADAQVAVEVLLEMYPELLQGD